MLPTMFSRARKALLGLFLAVATVALTACGGPSESDAKDTAVKVMTAMYQQDVKTVMSYIPKQDTMGSDELKMAESKLGSILALQAKRAEKKGGLDKIEAFKYTSTEQGDHIVTVRIYFKDGSYDAEDVKLRWDEQAERFYLQNQNK